MKTRSRLTCILAGTACLSLLWVFNLSDRPTPVGPTAGEAVAVLMPVNEAPDTAPAKDQPVDFAREVLPILSNHCLLCHGTDQDSEEAKKAGFRLDLRDEAVGFGMIEPGDAEASPVMDVLTTSSPSRRMPPIDSGKPQLTPEQVDTLRRWIDQGAEYTRHWAFVKPTRPEPPAVEDPAWCSNGIDHFVQAELAKHGLTPNEPADRHRLVRRVYLDLIGLPPTPEQAAAFVSDPSPDAYEEVVDELLASERFGEHWARQWLDKARYADSQGFEKDRPRTMWRYRDWVIHALNDDMPFDRFTREQLAGDLLEDPTPDQLIATGFHRNTQTNTEGGTDNEEFRSAAVIDRVNTTMEVWMGVTMGCVQCHSHKYDPLEHEEYYQLYAFFNQTRDADEDDDRPYIQAPTPAMQAELDRLRHAIDKAQQQLSRPDSELARAKQRWEAQALTDKGAWETPEIIAIESTGGAVLEVLDDGSIRASGESPATATYTIDAVTPLTGITAVRLEALPDEAFQRSGPGRSVHGNFVVDLAVTASPADGKPATPVARYLRIDLPGDNRTLSLAEVQAISGGANAAVGAKAMQSSTAYGAQAFFAIDGTTDGTFDEQSVTHTTAQRDPWWEADLGEAKPVEKVVLWNRTDNNLHDRLSGAVVTLMDADRRPVWQTRIDHATAEAMELVTTAAEQRLVLQHPSASFEQDGWPVAAAIDTDPNKGWAIMPQTGRPQSAVFETGVDVGHAGGTKLRFTLGQPYGEQHTLGRFRLSVTTRDRPVRVLPQDIRRLLETPPAERTAEQADAINAYFIEVAPRARSIRDEVAALRQQLAEAKSRVPTALVMKELPEDRRRETYLFGGGSFLAPDKEAGLMQPGTPAIFHPFPEDAPRNRLGLAQWLTHEDNPLTARVQVNRVWEQVWGIGLVETTNDFGFQGSYPSNKALLDYLAVTYQHDMDWSTKSLIRLIVTSSAYRQSAARSSQHAEIDPFNRLMSRGPRVRLSAEQVRDQALAVAGLLRTDRVGGPSVMPYLPEGMLPQAFDSYVQQSSSGDDVYRRGLYTAWRRTGHYPSFAAFDAPSREICTILRSRTNTPLQAFVTLNDTVYVEAAQALGRRMIAEAGDDIDARLKRGMQLALVRDPSPTELEALRKVYDDSLAEYEQDPEAAVQIATDPVGPLPEGIDAADAAAMTLVGNVLLNLDEVINKP